MKIVLFGSSGNIGKEILKQLLKVKTFQVICVVRKKNQINLKKVKYVEWDFLSFDKSNLNFLSSADVIINSLGKNKYTNQFDYINFKLINNLINYLILVKLKIRLIHLSSINVEGLGGIFFKKNLYYLIKLKADQLIKNKSSRHKKYLSYTILRAANVIGTQTMSNYIKFLNFVFKFNIWFKYSYKTKYNYIHIRDLSKSIILCLHNLSISKNKVYIICKTDNQFKLHEYFSESNNKNLFIIPLSKYLIKFIVKYIPLPQKIINMLFVVCAENSYDNGKIKNELGFVPKYSLRNKIL